MHRRSLILSAIALAGLLQVTSAAAAIIGDHTGTDPSVIPDSALDAARALRLVVRHASVGGNINDGLNDLAVQSPRYDRSAWAFSNRGNPGWEAKITDLTSYTAAHLGEYDVFTMKFCYIDQDASWAAYRDAMIALESANPTKTFVWWTMPIMTAGDAQRQSFNESVRAYCQANGRVLFDIADIECHDTSGMRHTDGSGNEQLVPAYTDDGGHLNAAGRVRVAGALWTLMAQVAGWSPVPASLTGFSCR